MAARNLDFSPKRRLIFEKLSGKEGEAKCLKRVSDHHFNLTVRSVLALSHGTKIDTSDCVALLLNGILHLCLTKDTYECLGIQGKLSPFNNGLRYDVEINLLAPYFKPDKKNYERVKTCFHRTQTKLKFLVSSVSKPGEEPANDLASYLKSSGIQYQQFYCKNEVEELLHMDIPLVAYDQPFQEGETNSECNGSTFHEWLGCVACGIDCSDAAPDSFVSRLCCPTPHQQTEVSCFCKWTGFLTSKSIQDLVEKSRMLLSENPSLPWLSVLVWGFSDCPVSWRNCRHGYYTSGDNHYAVVMFQDEQVWMYRTLGDNDVQP